MRRLTRAESQAHTRDRLIATATELFLREGYSATSLEQVAEVAGYSKGAVYSNFRNKDQLCLAVLDRARAEKELAADQTLAGADGVDSLLAAFAAWSNKTLGDDAWMALETEFLMTARHDPELRRELAARNADVLEAIGGLVNQHAERHRIELPIPADVASVALLSLALGVSLLRSVDAGVKLDALPALVGMLAQSARQ